MKSYLIYLRHQHRLSIKYVSKKTNIPYQKYRTIEKQDKELDMLPYRYLNNLAQFHNMTINQLLDANNHYKYNK